MTDPWEFEHAQTRLNGHERSWAEYERYMRDDPGWLPPINTIVCPQCGGKGTSSLYLGSFSQEQMHEDPDFYHDYMAGGYDRTCESCNGRNVVEVVNIEALDAEANESYMAYMQECYETDMIERQERRMGA